MPGLLQDLSERLDDAHLTDSSIPEAEILTPTEMLEQFPIVNICAPMVRYSKLPFRQLVSQYECHITTTPMMLAQEFSRSAIARDSDFSTNSQERGSFWMPYSSTASTSQLDEPDPAPEPRAVKKRLPGRQVKGALVAQFAANDGVQLAEAAELIRPWVDAIDLNCGCPQPWAYKDGVGSALLRNPETVRDLVRMTKQKLGWEFPVSVKIRIDPDLAKTNTLVRTAIAAGASYISVHGRTRHQTSSGHPVDLSGIKFAVEAAKGEVPVCANGDVFSLADAEKTRRETGVRGVMSARGLLANPALFAGYDHTPLSCISSFIDLSCQTGLLFPLFHRHVAYMLEGDHLPKKRDRVAFNALGSYAGVMDWCESRYGL